jgi:hypothetical protein
VVFKTPIGFGDGNSHKGDIMNLDGSTKYVEIELKY